MTSRKNTSINSHLLSRLSNDLKDLFENPYPGVEVHALEEDFRKFCLVLTPQSGPFWGLRLHFVAHLPESWPSDPPRIKSSSDLNHPNVFNSYICTDLLRAVSYGPAGYTGGYTPAFTLKGLFIQFLSFFSSEQVEQDYGNDIYIGNRFERFFLTSDEYERQTCYSFEHGYIYNPAEFPGRLTDEAYMKEYEAGGRDECVLSRESIFTIWRLSTKGKYRNVKVAWENPRYSDTLKKINKFTCEKCGYGTASMSRTTPVTLPKEYLGNIPKENTVKKLNRRLREISSLKERQLAGEQLQANQILKIMTYGETINKVKEAEAEMARGIPSIKPPEIQPKSQTLKSDNLNQSSSQPKICYLQTLNDDVLLAIAEVLPSESLISFGQAFPHMHDLAATHNLILRRELKCFFLRTPLNKPSTLLGVGVHVDEDTGAFESSFDWLSMDAFENFNIRKSVDKKDFEFFLPLAFSQVHFDRAYDSGKLFEYIDKIGTKTTKKWGTRSSNPVFAPNVTERRLNVLYKFCNSIVVSLMRTTDELYAAGTTGDKASKTLLFASEKACIGYLQIYHLLLCIMRREPDLRERALRRVKAFCSDDSNRSKSLVPDLGEFLVMAAVIAGSYKPARSQTIPSRSPEPANPKQKAEVEEGWDVVGQKKYERKQKKYDNRAPGIRNNFSWRKDLVGPFTDEVLARGTRWAIMKHRFLENPNPEAVGVNTRLRNTFEATRTSLRLVMFQVFFLETFTAEHITQQMDSQYGFTGPEVPAMITKGIKEIYEVKGYKLYCERIGLVDVAKGGPGAMSRMLRDAVVRSEWKGYHTPGQKYKVFVPKPKPSNAPYCDICGGPCGAAWRAE